MKRLIYIIGALLFNVNVLAQESFVKVKDLQFVINNEPYRYIGTNLWYGMYLGIDSDQGDRKRLIKELDRLEDLGVTNLRIMAASEGDGKNPYQNTPIMQTAPGVYDQKVLEGLDFFLSEMGKRKMKAVVCLGNFWMWSGGFPQYVQWANGSKMLLPDIEGGGTWDPFINYSLSFFQNDIALQMYNDHVAFILNRKNSINGVEYKNDPTVMSWQLANEPRAYSDVEGYLSWVNSAASLIKSIDTNHLVCIGSEGNTSSDIARIDLLRDNQSQHIDYATTHVWIQNWGWYDPSSDNTFQTALDNTKVYLDQQEQLAMQLGKPVVIEEFGVSRDKGSFSPEATVQFRDEYYQYLFNYTLESISNQGLYQGCNFWSWGGIEKADNPGGFWSEGDSYIGDPAHELQGWYSVYHDDQSTIEVIQRNTQKLNEVLIKGSELLDN